MAQCNKVTADVIAHAECGFDVVQRATFAEHIFVFFAIDKINLRLLAFIAKSAIGAVHIREYSALRECRIRIPTCAPGAFVVYNSMDGYRLQRISFMTKN